MLRLALPLGIKLLLAAAFISSSWSAASAQELRIRKLWYGIYQVKDSKEISDPTSPTGKRYENTGVTAPVVSSSDIRFRNEIYFGFGYRVDGDGTVDEIYLLPDQNGIRKDEPAFRRTRSVRNGDEHFIGWFTGDGGAKGNPLGNWTFQIRQNGRVIAEHSFHLSDR